MPPLPRRSSILESSLGFGADSAAPLTVQGTWTWRHWAALLQEHPIREACSGAGWRAGSPFPVCSCLFLRSGNPLPCWSDAQGCFCSLVLVTEPRKGPVCSRANSMAVPLFSA